MFLEHRTLTKLGTFREVEGVIPKKFTAQIQEKKIEDLLLIASDNDGINSPEKYHNDSFKIAFTQWSQENNISQEIVTFVLEWDIPAGYNADQMILDVKKNTDLSKTNGTNFLQWYLQTRPEYYESALEGDTQNIQYSDSQQFIERIKKQDLLYCVVTSTREDLIQILNKKLSGKLLDHAIALVAGRGIKEPQSDRIKIPEQSKPTQVPYKTARELVNFLLSLEGRNQIQPHQILTPEDSFTGARSALLAGNKTVFVNRDGHETGSIPEELSEKTKIPPDSLRDQLTIVNNLNEIKFITSEI